MKFVIDQTHIPYLYVQAGDISHWFDKEDLEHSAWRTAYEMRIEEVFKSMLPALPETCGSVLDIGGGLSGISARLNQHYDGRLFVGVLDGKNTLARVERHNQPFNNATQTQNFLRRNGVRSQDFYEPGEGINRTFDLVISTQAWGFHLAPSMYLLTVATALKNGGTLICDVRKTHPEWRDELDHAFGGTAMLLCEADKWERLAWKVGPIGLKG